MDDCNDGREHGKRLVVCVTIVYEMGYGRHGDTTNQCRIIGKTGGCHRIDQRGIKQAQYLVAAWLLFRPGMMIARVADTQAHAIYKHYLGRRCS
jgi:hypothetical protein